MEGWKVKSHPVVKEHMKSHWKRGDRPIGKLTGTLSNERIRKESESYKKSTINFKSQGDIFLEKTMEEKRKKQIKANKGFFLIDEEKVLSSDRDFNKEPKNFDDYLKQSKDKKNNKE